MSIEIEHNGPKGWTTVQLQFEDITHIIPSSERSDHSLGHDCTCGPGLELIQRPDNSAGVVYLHSLIDKFSIPDKRKIL